MKHYDYTQAQIGDAPNFDMCPGCGQVGEFYELIKFGKVYRMQINHYDLPNASKRCFIQWNSALWNDGPAASEVIRYSDSDMKSSALNHHHFDQQIRIAEYWQDKAEKHHRDQDASKLAQYAAALKAELARRG